MPAAPTATTPALAGGPAAGARPAPGTAPAPPRERAPEPAGDAARAAELLGTRRPDALREAHERALREGRIVDTSRDPRRGGLNGKLDLARVERPGGDPLMAVVKDRTEQAPQEHFVYELATTLGIERNFATVARRDSGRAYVQFVRAPGNGDWIGAKGLEAVLETGARERGLRGAAAKDAAQVEASLLRFVDYLVANSDRRGPNVLVDEGRGRVWWIDNGLAGNGDIPTQPSDERTLRLRPLLQPQLLRERWNDLARVELHPAAVALIRERLTPERLAELHAGMLRAADTKPRAPRGAQQQYRQKLQDALQCWVSGPDYLANMQARLAHVLRHGSFDYTPFG